MSSALAYLCLGSNLGDRALHLACGRDGLRASGVEIQRASRIYETEPTDYLTQPWFLNQVLAVRTELGPAELQACCARVECACGREETFRYGPRVLDVDILLYGDAIIDEPDLRIPHTRLLERRFMLSLLLELEPNAVDPRDGHALKDDLEGLDGKKVTPLTEHAS